MQLTLRYQETAQRPAGAALLRGTDPAAWLREIARWGLPAEQLSCYLVPESIRSVRPAGLFVVVAEGALPADVLEPYGVVAERLYVPVQATLWPATTPAELRAALLWPRQLWHPGIGMVGFDTADALDLAAMLDCGPPRPTDWTRARPGLAPKPRLQQVRVLAPTAAEVVQAIRENIGTAALAQLPGAAEAQTGPIQRAFNGLHESLLQLGLAMVRHLPSVPAGRIVGWWRWLVLGLVGGTLFVGLLIQLARGRIGAWITPAVMVVVIRLLQSLTEKANSNPAHLPAAPAKSGASTKPGLFKRLEGWLGGRIQDLEQKRQNEIERLLRLFSENPAQALKYAIPLGGPYQDRGTAAPSARLGRRITDFNLGGLGGGRRADAWHLDEYRDSLRQQYLAAANQEIEAGRHRKAAYIHAHLLGDYHTAANVLNEGGFCREAATLYKDHLHNRPAAAECLERGGLLLEAAELYAELSQHEKAGNLYQHLEQPEVAARHYERGVALFLGNGDHPEAARLLAGKLTDVGRAQEVLLQGWVASKQPETCLKQYFDVVAAEPEVDLSTHVRDIFRHCTPAERRVPLLQVLAAVNKKHPAPALRAASLDVAYEVVSAEALAGNATPLPMLRDFLPEDRLIAADCSRYTTSRPRPLAGGPPAQLVAPQLDATIQWKGAVPHGHQWVAVGVRDERLHLARGNWYGNVEYYSWTIPVINAGVELVTNELYGSRILLRPSSPLALETKYLPKNKYFPEALTVECPSWLPAWPAPVALLPEGATATAQLQGLTITVERYSAEGKLLPSLVHQLRDVDPASFASPEQGGLGELIHHAGVYCSYWSNYLIWWAEDGRGGAHEVDGQVHQLVRSAYSAELRLAAATDKGLLLWAPTRPSDNTPVPTFSVKPFVIANLQFVGSEHLAGIDASGRQLYHLGVDGHHSVREIDISDPPRAVLPTSNRQQFALLESTGRIWLHRVSND